MHNGNRRTCRILPVLRYFPSHLGGHRYTTDTTR
ncbi:hypothetical protein BX264_2736 [Streptomyces sp. 2333.5]|nr:hypothetical protein BX264_2736 [Streptomyces sp. 2333.5]SED08063.1 hypothetical protein SAMN05428943_2874 [Streptomyces sp. 2314.4]SED95068.1 hypothetical protein SAMN05428942_2839 [Streptomyces sp. 2112.2]